MLTNLLTLCFVFLALLSVSARAERLGVYAFNACEGYLDDLVNGEVTAQWISAMVRLGERPELLSSTQFSRWLESIVKGKIASPFHTGAFNTESMLWHRLFERLMATGQVDSLKLRKHSESLLLELVSLSASRSIVGAETESVIVRAQFVDSGWTAAEVRLPPPPGGEEGAMEEPLGWGQRQVYVMTTLFTQGMWTQLMLQNPSFFAGPKSANHPVENVSVSQIRELLLKLNDRKTATDLIRAVILDHEAGDLYTIPSYQFYRVAKYQHDEAFFTNATIDLCDHVWFAENSGDETHSVGQLEPIDLNGHQVFDWYGNVREWSLDMWDRTARGEFLASKCGGSFDSPRATFRAQQGPAFGMDNSVRFDEAYSALGFRLVRVRAIWAR